MTTTRPSVDPELIGSGGRGEHNISENSPPKIEELESLRGIAATLVVFVHFPAWNPWLYDIDFFRNGTAMVDLFFVLSGFVICMIYGDRLNSTRDVLRFQLLRLGRLYPVHFLFFLAFFAIEVAKWIIGAIGYPEFEAAAFTANGFSDIISQLTLTQALGPSIGWGTFNGPAWSISVEFYCYLLFALVVLVFGRAKWHVFGFFALLGLTSSVFAIIDNSAIYRCLAGFFTGCIVSGICARKPSLEVPAWLQWAIFVSFFLYVGIFIEPYQKVGVFLIAAALILAIAKGRDGSLRRLLRMRPFVAMGAWSYSIYMSHVLVIYIFLQATIHLSTASTVVVSGVAIPQFSIADTLALYSVVLIVVTLVSALICRIYELPLRIMSRRLIFSRLGGPLPFPKLTSH
ncbi:acyltransferase family protein [Parasphingorhabdus halotolerans]|uniref:Acyltransferase n=1 Tax=Parasphingorhabdus halotolerans TaxID=2725558 RepID=A0A6H2DQM9_9SPHN|nr:acyltransferase [Parasphingorhabdus halotolerans]QJB69976.1 acyltransferase [Parasphingorhabdus halotolerans]